jgi:Tfp pilus assembly protein PilO
MTNQELLDLARRFPVTVVCGGLIVIFSAALYFRSSALAEAEALYQERLTEGQELLANVANGLHIEEHVNDLTEATATIEARLVRQAELARNLQYFYRIESETGVLIRDLRQGSPPPLRPNTPRPIYVGIPYSVSVEGSFAQVLTFLRRLETGQSFYRTKALTCVPSERAGVVILTLNLELLGWP